MDDLKQSYKTIPCNLCGSDNYTVVYPPRHDLEKDKDLMVKFRSSGDETLIDQVVRCRQCGLVYINPVLDARLVLEGYEQGTDETFVSQNAARERTFAKCLKVIEEHHPQKGRILDVGTAGGAFLRVCQEQGWEVEGCEPNRWLCRWAGEHYGIKIAPGTLFDQDYADGSFDVITLWDVLEHTPEPKRVVAECRRLLKPRGLLVINYPDFGSWIARLMKRKWVFLLSVHLFYFDKKTMARLLADNGFEPKTVRPHFQYLESGYIFSRARAYVGLVADWAQKGVRALRLDKCLVPYWMGQTLVIARKAN